MIAEAVYLILNQIENAMVIVRGYSEKLMIILLTIDFAVSGLLIAMGKKASIEDVTMKLLITGIIVWLINDFEHLAFMFQESVVQISGRIGGHFNIDFLLNPSLILQYANEEILEPLSDLMDQATGWLTDLKIKLIFGFAFIGIMLSFLIITLQLALALIEFHFIVLAALFLLPFVLLDATKFIGMKTFPAVIGHAIKLGIVVMVVSVTMNVYQTIVSIPASVSDFSMDYIIMLVGVTLLMTFISIQVPALANSLLSGVPNLSASGMLQNIGAMAMTAGIGAKMLTGGGVGTASALKGVGQGVSGSGVSGGSGGANTAGRVAGTVMRGLARAPAQAFRAAENATDKAAPGKWLAGAGSGGSQLPGGSGANVNSLSDANNKGSEGVNNSKYGA